MLFHQFYSRFPTEDVCIEYFKSIRMHQDILRPEYGTAYL